MTDFSKLSDYIIGIRRTLHKHPELSGQEFQTQQQDDSSLCQGSRSAGKGEWI